MAYKILVIGFGPIGGLLALKMSLKYPESNIIIYEKKSH